MPSDSVQITKVTQDLTHLSTKDLLPGSIPPEAMPTPEFIATVKRIEERKNQPLPVASQPTTLQTPLPAPPEQERKPIVLEYKYTGHCPVCFNQVDTLMLTVHKTLIAMAYCTTCKADRGQRKVVPIGKEEKHGNTNVENRVSVPKTVRKMSQSKKIPVQGKP